MRSRKYEKEESVVKADKVSAALEHNEGTCNSNYFSCTRRCHSSIPNVGVQLVVSICESQVGFYSGMLQKDLYFPGIVVLL